MSGAADRNGGDGHTSTESASPDRRFVEWSHRAVTNPTIWPKEEPKPPATMLIKEYQGPISRYPVVITEGEPDADIGLDHASVRFPEPFDGDTLTDACKVHIITSMREAGEWDRKFRWVSWGEGGDPFPCHRVNGRWPRIRLRSKWATKPAT